MSRLRFLLFDNAFGYVDSFAPQQSETNLLWNDASICSYTVPDDHPLLPVMAAGEARVQVRFDGEPVMEGAIVSREGSGPRGSVTHTVLDDFGDLDSILGWPNPAAALSVQTSDYAHYAGPLDDVALQAIADNVARLGLSWTIPASAHVGESVQVDFRFHSMYEKLVPLFKAQKLQLRVRRVDGSLVVSVAEGRTFSRPLTLSSGVIASYKWAQTRATRTRTVAGGRGQAEDRDFAQFIDTGLEESQGVREGFKDARMTEDPTYLPTQAQTATQDAGPRSTVEATLNESPWFRFSPGSDDLTAYRLGDILPVDLGFVTVEDVISSINIKDTPDNGLTVTPKVGLLDTSPDARVYRLLSQLRSSVRDQEKR